MHSHAFIDLGDSLRGCSQRFSMLQNDTQHRKTMYTLYDTQHLPSWVSFRHASRLRPKALTHSARLLGDIRAIGGRLRLWMGGASSSIESLKGLKGLSRCVSR